MASRSKYGKNDPKMKRTKVRKMSNRRYELGKRGLKFALSALRDGRSLSQALVKIARQARRTFALLPDGMNVDDVYNLERHLHYQTVIPVVQDSSRLFANYSCIDAFVSVMSNLAVDHPNGAVWVEDYLARVEDPAFSDDTLTKLGVSTLFLDNTVTHLVSLKAFSSSLGSVVASKLRTVPVWNGVVLDDMNPYPIGGKITNSIIVENMISRGVLLFCTAYDTDSFVFVELSENSKS